MLKIPYILLVDDDSTTNYLNKMLLTRLAVAEEVLVALNGQEALTVLASRPPVAPGCQGLLFLDVKMPIMDGFEFLAAYQQLPPAQQQAVAIVMLTTSLHPQDVRRVEQLPIAGFLSKPLTLEKVQQVVENILLKK